MDVGRSKREDPSPGNGRGPMRRSSGEDRRIPHRHIPRDVEETRRLQEARWKDNDKRMDPAMGYHPQRPPNTHPHTQVTRFDHENLAKMYDQLLAKVRMLQHEKDKLQDLEGRYMDELKSMKISLEEMEEDRNDLRYMLTEKKREVERLNEQMACLGPTQESSKQEVSRVLHERDQLRSRLIERKRDNQKLQEKLSNANRMLEAGKGDAPTDQRVAELQSQVSGLQHQLSLVQRDRDSFSEANTQLKRSLDISDAKIRELDSERLRLSQMVTERRSSSPVRPQGRLTGERFALSHGISDEMLSVKRHRLGAGLRAKSSQGSIDEDFHLSDNPNSLTDLTSITRSDSGHTPLSGGQEVNFVGRARGHSLGKFSSSTSNLISDGSSDKHHGTSRMSDHNNTLRLKVIRIEKSMEDLRKEKLSLTEKISKSEQEAEFKVQSVTSDLKKVREEAAKKEKELKTALEQINLLTKEKGVAMRDNATSYEQSIQKETQMRELQAEKQILEQQRDIANKERERVIGDLVGLKKKLETIKAQRQKDAKDLSLMRHLKDKAVQEVGDLRKKVDKLQNQKDIVSEELGTVQDTVHRAMVKLSPRQRHRSSLRNYCPAGAANEDAGAVSVTKDLREVIEKMAVLENEKKVITKRLFGPEEPAQGRSLSDVLHKVDSLYQERDDLVLEINALQQSSSKLNEERIFDLKQRIEDLLMEQDALSSRNSNLKREGSMMSNKLMRAEDEKERFAVECERLQLQCEQMKSTQARLVEEHSKTLERVTELWKQKWPVNWDDAWEEKHVSIDLDSGGLAGFSVVGGRDQPQLPNPGAFIVTTVNQGGPAEGQLKVGDILESVNGINLDNADHREAVRAVKETKRTLSIIFRRRKSAYPIVMGIVQSVNSVPHPPPPQVAVANTETLEYSLYVTSKEKSDLGFKFDWSTVCTVTDVAAIGPATQILEPGDRIIKVNNQAIQHEKPSNIKKLMKPHKNILRLEIERPHNQNDRSYLGQALPAKNGAESWTDSKRLSWASTSTTPVLKPKRAISCEDNTQQSSVSHDSELPLSEATTQRRASLTNYKPQSRESYSSRDSKDYSCETESQDSSGNKPTKLVSMVTAVKRNHDSGAEAYHPQPPQQQPPRPTSDGVIYGNFNERRIEYEEVLLSERTDSQYSQSESYLSESSYYGGLSSSQSIDLTFHSFQTAPSHNRLTVDTMMTTQAPTQHHSDEEEGTGVGFMARDDASRTTFRNRSAEINSNGNNCEGGQSQPSEYSDSQYTESQLSIPESTSMSQDFIRGKHSGIKGMKKKRRRFNRHKSSSQSLAKLSNSDQNLARGGQGSLVSMRGRSRSQLSLGRAPSMTQLVEEPRRATSTTNVTEYEHDPLADATYIRANFSYIPRTVKELSIKASDIFHIHDEAPPERFRASFWVSRLNADGTDEQIGAIPNSMRAQEYLEAQGEAIDVNLALYEEVEAFTGRRPVLVFGALCDQVVSLLLESYPTLFYACPTEYVEGAARITEARLGRDPTIIDFRRRRSGYELYRADAISSPDSKSKHCLMTGSIKALHTLRSIAPPITILIKAMTSDSIITFSPDQIPTDEAKAMFERVCQLEDEHSHEFSGALFLIYMDTLMGQIEDIVKKEKRKQAWVPVTKET
ncbi:disks large homolog 5-like isoform X2 [Halichondria panicea]|uniref:disks large homolog 5-like isoform X2 n=1 Tax=Halichondria panicea TaxID=6063 RepID=UPI00312B464F